MAQIDADPVTPGELAQWYELRETLAKVKQAEALLRARIYRHYFKDPKEGTNSFDIDDGTGAVLKAQRVIDRKVDVGAFDALRKTQNEQWGEQRTPGAVPSVPLLKLDELVKWKPEVSITEYRKLTDNERAYFEQCLVIKDGSPQLDVVIPKRAKV
jgi:hypothetical protein